MGASRTRTTDVAGAAGPSADPSPPTGLPGLAEAFAAELLFGSLSRAQVVEATREAATAHALPAPEAALLLHRLVARDPLFLRVEPAAAIEAQLRAVPLLAPLTHASLWLESGAGQPLCLAAAGISRPQRPIRLAAARGLGAPLPASAAGSPLRTVPVRVPEGRGVLVVLTRHGKRRAGLAHAAETASALVPVLDRRRLLVRALESAAQMVEAVERRVTRLGFDVHDGPLQRMSLLAGELTLLGRQLPVLVSDGAARAVAERRVGDMVELAGGVTRELRDLARAAGGHRGEPLGERLEQAARELERRTGITVEVVVEGPVDRMTDSQRIAAARVVEEALANVGDHSRATRARVSVSRGRETLRVTIEDDGRGFDVERALRASARAGRLGLVSMRERVRMLGGSLEIRSRRGGPTLVAAELPAWDPFAL